MNAARLLFPFTILLVIVGCGKSGPQRYELSGAVTYAGKPLPVGYIVFVPDASQENNGPGSQVSIRDGRYQLSQEQGVLGGRYLATITGFDGKPIQMDGMINSNGRAVFQDYRVAVELPHAASIKDFDISFQKR